MSQLFSKPEPINGGASMESPEVGKFAGLTGKSLLWRRAQSLVHLISGNVGVAILMFGSISVAARALGPSSFGAFVLVLAIGRVSERIVRFESWQPLVRYVAAEELAANSEDIARLYAYGLLLDIGAALTAALIAVVSAIALAPLVGLEADQTGLVAIYAIAIACNIRGVPSAAMRMAGRFRTLAYVQAVSAIARLILAFVLLGQGAGVLEFIVLWTTMQMLDAAIFNLIGFRSLRDQGVPNLFLVNWRGLPERFPGFLGFAFSTNLSSTLRTLTHEADTLLVGFFIGPGAAGMYFLARRIAKVAQQIGDAVQMVTYPDLARMWAGAVRGEFGRVVTWVQLLLGGFGVTAILGVWLLGKPLLHYAFGADFVDAYPLLLAQMVAVMLLLHAAPSRSALLAMNRPKFVLGTAAFSTVVFFATASLAIPQFGALGANIAHIAFGLASAVVLDIAMWKGIRRLTKDAES
jgi:O-antigen/teichoic acid export membrane protein